MIVWLASYPKSGRAAVSVLLDAAFGLKTKLLTAAPGSPSELPSSDWQQRYMQLHNDVELHVVAARNVPVDDGPSIYVVRDPRQAYICLRYQLVQHYGEDIPFDELVAGLTGVPTWHAHANRWLTPARTTPLVINHADLMNDPAQVVQRIADYLDRRPYNESLPTVDELAAVDPDFPPDRTVGIEDMTISMEEHNLTLALCQRWMEMIGIQPDEAPDIDAARAMLRAVQTKASGRSYPPGLVDMAMNQPVPDVAADVTEDELDRIGPALPDDDVVDASGDIQAAVPTDPKQETAHSQGADSTATAPDADGTEADTADAGADDAAQEAPSLAASASTMSEPDAPETAIRSQDTAPGEGVTAPGHDAPEEAAFPVAMSHGRSVSDTATAGDLSESAAGPRPQADEIEADDVGELVMGEYVEALISERDELIQRLSDFEARASRDNDNLEALEHELQRLREDQSNRMSFGSQLEAKISQLDSLASQHADEITRLRADIGGLETARDSLRATLSQRDNKVAELTAKSVEREGFIKSLETTLSLAKDREKRLVERNSILAERCRVAQERLTEMHKVMTPRLRTVLSFRATRYIMKTRRQLKAGELELDEQGLPVLQGDQGLPLDGELKEVELPKRQPRPEYSPASAHVESRYADYQPHTEMGIAVYAFDRVDCLENVLESLSLQDALPFTHVWIDGDQGKPDKRKIIDRTEELARSYNVKAVHRNRGNFGFRKMMIVSMRRMMELYDRVLFLEDDCFPTRHAVRGFQAELDEIQHDASVLSVYGHHFKVEGENGRFPRFQGWGWAALSERLRPVWHDLLQLYLMTEEEYLEFVRQNWTPEVQARIDVTPGRQPSSTVPRFFAWDEALGFLSALHKLQHTPSAERIIYNFGAGHGSTHFTKIDHYRKPPFNMVSIEELWNYF